MMRFHKEGYKIILFSTLVFALLIWGGFQIHKGLGIFLSVGLGVFYILILQFFRNPQRTIPTLDDRVIYAPADGKVVVIEQTEETEYFKDQRIQVSIFMSPLNVHVNRNSISGMIKYYKYHAGKYLVAWHPKSSTENERTTYVLENEHGTILLRQIAGAVARRIINYAKVGSQVQQGTDFGFIRFGSRVDIFLPLDAKIHVNIDEVVKGNKTRIASF